MTYSVVSELSDAHIADLVELYGNEFWSQYRQPEDVVQMLRGTDVVVGFVNEHDRLIAFTRVLTDFVYRAVIFDVIVKPSDRQKGLGAKLLDRVVEHPQLRSVECFLLFCLPEMIPFYERWEFSVSPGGMQLMARFQPKS